MTFKWHIFNARRGTDQRLIPSGRAASEPVGRTAVPCPGETPADGSMTPSLSETHPTSLTSAHTRRQTDPQSLRRATGLRLVPVHGAVSDPAAETYPAAPLASRRAPTQDEIAQMRLDVLDGYATLGRILSTPAINQDAEARRQWAIDICTSEIARMERNLLELRQA